MRCMVRAVRESSANRMRLVCMGVLCRTGSGKRARESSGAAIGNDTFGSGQPAAGDQRGGIERAGEEKTLREVDAAVGQRQQITRLLDAFGDDARTQSQRELRD